MEEKGFFHTKSGQLTAAFIVIMAAFIIIMAGLYSDNDSLCLAGFIAAGAAMLYSPFKVHIYDYFKRNK